MSDEVEAIENRLDTLGSFAVGEPYVRFLIARVRELEGTMIPYRQRILDLDERIAALEAGLRETVGHLYSAADDLMKSDSQPTVLLALASVRNALAVTTCLTPTPPDRPPTAPQEEKP